jgi:hypothetical protein
VESVTNSQDNGEVKTHGLDTMITQTMKMRHLNEDEGRRKITKGTITYFCPHEMSSHPGCQRKALSRSEPQDVYREWKNKNPPQTTPSSLHDEQQALRLKQNKEAWKKHYEHERAKREKQNKEVARRIIGKN